MRSSRTSRRAGLEASVDSAGTSSHYVGEPPHAGARQVLARHNIAFEHVARQITKHDLSRFDLIVAMDRWNRRDIRFLFGAARVPVVRLLDYAPHVGVADVPDPYFSGDWDGAFEIVRAGVEGLVAQLQSEEA